MTVNWPFRLNTKSSTGHHKGWNLARPLCGCPQWKSQVEVSRWGGRTKHLERWRDCKHRGFGGRLSREMRAPPAPCRDWVGHDISNLLKLIASQTRSSLPSPSVVKPMPRLWRVMMNGLNVKDLKPCLDPLATLHLVFCLSSHERNLPLSSGMLACDIFYPENECLWQMVQVMYVHI